MDSKVERVPAGKLSPVQAHVIKISVSEGHRGRVVNKQSAWWRVPARLDTPTRDDITLAQYEKLSKNEQTVRKNRGYLVGGWFDKGIRKVDKLQHRDLGTFDIDDCTPDQAEEILTGAHPWLSEFEYSAYTTRSHSPEEPRLRILIPMFRSITPGEYTPFARIVAEKIDGEMIMVSKETFNVAQFMYWPSVSQGQEYRHFHNVGRLIDAKTDVFEPFGEFWNNYERLPRRPDEKDIRKAEAKTTDPRTKNGWIGAFCRTFSISTAIETFLSDVYEESETDGSTVRYTYLPGATVNGAVVYDDDMQMFSNHGTDPCGGRLVNPWDMCRIHLFNDLDKSDDIEEAAGNPNNLPSQKAMLRFIQEDARCKDVLGDFADHSVDLEAMEMDSDWDLDDEPEEEREPTPGSIGVKTQEVTSKARIKKETKPENDTNDAEVTSKAKKWMDALDLTDKGGIRATLHNVALILKHDSRFKGKIAYNELSDCMVLIGRILSKTLGVASRPIAQKEMGNLIGEQDFANIRRIMESPRGEGKPGWGLKVSERDLRDGLWTVAEANRFHPIQNYLNGCMKIWDGKPRMQKMFTDYWGCVDNEYTREVAMIWTFAGVARAFYPGYKFDLLPIFEGPQDAGKSIAGEFLGNSIWFAEFLVSDRDMTDPRKIVENMNGKWILQMPELTHMLRTDNEVLKAFFSTNVRRTRTAYSRGPQDFRQQCIMYGTTNEKAYLSDPTGNRRYLPLRIGKINLRAIKRDRDQLWGEAATLFFRMKRAYDAAGIDLILELTDDSKAFARQLQGQRMIVGQEQMWQSVISAWLEEPQLPKVARGGSGHVNKDDGFDPDNDDAEKSLLILPVRTCVHDIALHVLQIDYNGRGWTQTMGRSIARILDNLPGWHRLPKLTRIGRLNPTAVWERVNPNSEDDDTDPL